MCAVFTCDGFMDSGSGLTFLDFAQETVSVDGFGDVAVETILHDAFLVG